MIIKSATTPEATRQAVPAEVSSAPETQAAKAERLAAAIEKADSSDPMLQTANRILGDLQQPQTFPDRLADADAVLYFFGIDPAKRNGIKPLRQRSAYGGTESATAEHEALPSSQSSVFSDEERRAAIAASIAAVQGSPGALPVELVGPVTPPLDDAEKAAALVRQPASIGAAAIQDTLHPGSSN